MDVEVNYIAVVLAALSTMVLGGIWYAKGVFGKIWAEKVGLTDEQLKKGAPKAMVLAILGALLQAYLLAHITFLSNSYFDNSFMYDSLMTAFWVWIGLIATTIFIRNGFEQTPKVLTLGAIGYEFVKFLTMGLIIGAFGL